MKQLLLSILLTLCALTAYAELVGTEEAMSAGWVVHEYPSALFPITYSRHIHDKSFRGGCGVSVWTGGSRLRIEAYDNRWYGKQLVQVVTFEKSADGSIAQSEHRTETYVGSDEHESGPQRVLRRGVPSAHKLGVTLPVAGYDVFQTHCTPYLTTLPLDVQKVFQELYRPTAIKQ